MKKKPTTPKGKGKGSKPKNTPRQAKPVTPIKKITTNKKTQIVKIEVENTLIELTPEAIKEIAEELGLNITRKRNFQFAYTPHKADNSDTTRLKTKMIQALELSLGVVTPAVRAVGINRDTHYDWLASDEHYADIVREINEVGIDLAETMHFKLIIAGDRRAGEFHLKTKGKKRGYIETVHNLNQNLDDTNVQFYVPDNGRDAIEEAKVVNE